MKAAILIGFGAPLELAELPTPTPGDDEVLIQLEACGVCHSDLSIIGPDAWRRHLRPGGDALRFLKSWL